MALKGSKCFWVTHAKRHRQGAPGRNTPVAACRSPLAGPYARTYKPLLTDGLDEMDRQAKAIISGIAIGALIGLLRAAFDDPSSGGGYVPQSLPGWAAYYGGYSLPYAAIGAVLGFGIGRKSARATSDAAVPHDTGKAQIATTAVQRLGHVLGWAGNLIALPIIALGLYALMQERGEPLMKALLIGAGVVVFLIGRALRYVLAGPSPRATRL